MAITTCAESPHYRSSHERAVLKTPLRNQRRALLGDHGRFVVNLHCREFACTAIVVLFQSIFVPALNVEVMVHRSGEQFVY